MTTDEPPLITSRQTTLADVFINLLTAVFFLSTGLFSVSPTNKATFAILLLYSAFHLVFARRSAIPTFAPVLILGIFMYGFTLSHLNQVDDELAKQFAMSPLVLLLIYPIYWHSVDVTRHIKLVGVLLAVYTMLLYVAVSPSGFNLPGKDAFVAVALKYSNAAFGNRDYFDGKSTLMVQIGTMAFLFLPFSLFFASFLERKTWRNSSALLLISTAVVLSASRALWAFSLASAGLLFFLRLKPGRRIALASAAIPLAVMGLILVVSNTRLFSPGEESNQIKIGHTLSFIDNLTPLKTITGEGLGSYYFSSGRGTPLAHTEITPLDLFRYLGIFWVPIIYLALAFPSLNRKRYFGSNTQYTVVFWLHLLLSATNPTLFNSAGLLPVLWYWAIILERPKELLATQPLAGRV